MQNIVQVALESVLSIRKDILMDTDQIQKLPAEQIVILSTGSQGEPMSALTRMARSTHRKVDIVPGYTVLIASTPIPGNERHVGREWISFSELGLM